MGSELAKLKARSNSTPNGRRAAPFPADGRREPAASSDHQGPGLASRRTRTARASGRIASLDLFFGGPRHAAEGKRRIKVCVVDVLLQIGGAEWFTALLMKYADSDMFEFVVVCYRPQAGGMRKYLESLRVRVVSAASAVGQAIGYDQWRAETLFTMLEAQRPDVVFFPVNFLYAELPKDRLRGYQVAVRISNFDERELEAVDFSAAQHVICCSDEQAAYFSRRHPEKVVVAKTGVDLQMFCPASHAERVRLREQLGLPPEKAIVLFCGRLGDPQKRLDLFMKVVDEVAKRRSDVAFSVAGYFETHRDEGKDVFKTFAASRGIFWKAEITPWEIANYFRAADVLLSVSVGAEGLSNTVLQAMACGVEPVVTPASGMAELVTDGETGTLLHDDSPATVATSLLHAVDRPAEQRMAIAIKARERVRGAYDVQSSVDQYERAFYGAFRAAPAQVGIVDGSFGIGGAEWLAALLCLNSDPTAVRFRLLLHTEQSDLAGWLARQGVAVSAASANLSYNMWRGTWLPRMFNRHRPHVVMPCTSTTWDLSVGLHRMLGISQNASDSEVLQSADYEQVSYLICVSEDVMLGLNPSYRYKMSVLRNSIDVAMFRRDEQARAEIRRQIGCGDKRVVLWCGRMSEHRKRLDVLCKVIEECQGQQGLHFLVVGYFGARSEGREQWETFLERHPNVTWVTGLKHWETPPYFSAADVYLSTSGYTGADFEGLSLAAVQALASGLPIVSTMSGGQREVVTEGVNGFLTPTGDAVALVARLKLLASGEESALREIGARNVARAAADFDIKAHARRFETICWALKNSVGSALPYDPKLDVELLTFADEPHLSEGQRHQASFFVNHLSPLLIDNGRRQRPSHVRVAGSPDASDEQPWDERTLIRGLAGRAAGRCHEFGCDVLSDVAGSRTVGGSLAPIATDRRPSGTAESSSQLDLVVLGEGLSYGQLRDGIREAASQVASGGAVVLRGLGHPGVLGQAGRGQAACALLDHLADHFPLWRRPYQVGGSVVLTRA